MMNQIISWSKGNPGAMAFLLSLTQPENAGFGIIIISKLNELPIRGTDLYVLWSDLCGKDLVKVANLCDNCPDDVLVDACSRQDYSGMELIKKYI